MNTKISVLKIGTCFQTRFDPLFSLLTLTLSVTHFRLSDPQEPLNLHNPANKMNNCK